MSQWTKSTKPSRSDVVLDPDEQLKITDHVRAQFDSVAPKRPSKPTRSEPDSSPPSPAEPSFSDHAAIPELEKLHSLRTRQSQVVFSAESGATTTVSEEFVETQYYRELGSIDKQHHTTGSGFIKVVREESEERNLYDFHVGLREGHFGGAFGTLPVSRSNPAMNDWVPKMEEDHFSSGFDYINNNNNYY